MTTNTNLSILVFSAVVGDKWLSDTASEVYQEVRLKVIYHPLYSLNNFVTDKSKLPQVFSHVTI